MARPRIGVTCSTMDETEGHGVRRLQVPEPYVRCVEAAGGLALLLPVTDPSRVPEVLPIVDGVLLVGGDDVDPALYGAVPHPRLGPVHRPRDLFEIEVVRQAAAGGVPTLGVCRGVQVMNVALGGTLHQHLPETVPTTLPHGGRFDEAHPVDVVPASRLAAILGRGPLSVNSHHHQSIERVAPGLAVTATAPDGVVEAAESPGPAFLLGVQWHPERLGSTDATRRLFAAFVAAAEAFARARAAR
jgi:putative glutamine amidotransferase